MEIFTVENLVRLDMTFYFGSVINSSVYLLGVVVIVLFVISIIFLFMWNLKMSLIIQLISLILYIVRIVILYFTEFQIGIVNILTRIFIFIYICSTFGVLLYSKAKLGFSKELKIFEKSKLEKILRVSEKINLEIVRNILEMDQKTFQERVIDYSKQYGMKVEGNNLIINKENLDDFLNSLEDQFKEWEKEESFKTKKI